ncbi:trimeric intracellular cation channel family protein [Aquabacterium sp. A7-Y]|uniref:trimeric intracellular cation channel family protein n=1 Tax=Aquabacterium sp. A7-Y TaxID=1349605 RepID=UPI00223D67E3|nr:trimeric intracellular cation channel family protein [Aquabacterium sp. A7-Y]MCW7538796.1 trimeric intracellular cation channel family protein [Aquabacterium sp. A7-Y]
MDVLRLEGLRLVIEVAATLAFALSGLLEAARRRLDPVGACVVAFLAAFGGGTLRDLLLDQRPFFWVRHPEYVWAVLALGVVAMAVMKARHLALTERAIQVPDALGLGLFAAAGVDLALGLGHVPLIAVLMGVVTGVFGGVLRDIVCNEIPTVFKDHRPYAVVAFAGGWLYVGLDRLEVPAEWRLAATVVGVAGARGLAVARRWELPAWRV